MLDRIVVQFGDRMVKGLTDRTLWYGEGVQADPLLSPPIQVAGDPTPRPIDLTGVKAVFFVKTFEGKEHDDLRFYDHLDPQPCLWVRITFTDGEVIEGIVRNDSTIALGSAFFMAPVDPEGNNWLIYVLKSRLRNFQVLGLRPAPAGLFAPAHAVTA
jgi:hypothetical protein